LERLDISPIIIAITKQKMFHFEEVFRSQNLLIVNTVCKEFVFVLTFFDLQMAQIAPIFNSIFARVINKYLEWLEAYTCPSSGQGSSNLISQVADKN
jgi:hypothetical protein